VAVAVAVVVSVGVAVAVAVLVAEALGDALSVAVGVAVGVAVTVSVAVCVAVAVAVAVAVVVAVAVELGVADDVTDGVGVAVAVEVVVAVAVVVGVAVAVAVAVGVPVAVAVGVGVAPFMPLPSSSMCCGLFWAESVNDRPFFAFIFPGLVGWNPTETVHIPLAGIVSPQVSPVTKKGAVTLTSVIEIAVVLDWLVSVMVFGVLMVVSTTSPKLMVVGLIFSLGALTFDAASSADCANTGRAKAVSRNISMRVRPASDRANDLKRI